MNLRQLFREPAARICNLIISGLYKMGKKNKLKSKSKESNEKDVQLDSRFAHATRDAVSKW